MKQIKKKIYVLTSPAVRISTLPPHKNLHLLIDTSRKIWGECKLYSLCPIQTHLWFDLFEKHTYTKRRKIKLLSINLIPKGLSPAPHQPTCSLLAVVDLLMQDFSAGLGLCSIKHSFRDLTHLLSKTPLSRTALTALHVHPWCQTGLVVSPKLFLFISSVSLTH